MDVQPDHPISKMEHRPSMNCNCNLCRQPHYFNYYTKPITIDEDCIADGLVKRETLPPNWSGTMPTSLLIPHNAAFPFHAPFQPHSIIGLENRITVMKSILVPKDHVKKG